MLALVVVLLATNLVTAAALIVRHVRSRPSADDSVEVFEAPRPPGGGARGRRLITIEVLNPLELASSRAGRLAGLAGTLAPGLTRKLVYDQVCKTLQRELDRMAVHADVRLHTLRSVPRPQRVRPPARPDDRVVDAVVVDEVAPLDLDPDVS